MTLPKISPKEIKTCPRCGVRRAVRAGRNTDLCVDCKSIDPRFGKPRMGRPPKPLEFLWTSEAQIRAAHAQWTYGFKTPRNVEGHRLYMREHKRLQRARQRDRDQHRRAA